MAVKGYSALHKAPSDFLVSYPNTCWVWITPLQRWSQCILQPQLTGLLSGLSETLDIVQTNEVWSHREFVCTRICPQKWDAKNSLETQIGHHILTGTSPSGVVVNMLSYDVVQCESCYYIHFRANIVGKSINSSTPGYGLNSTTTLLLKRWLWHKITQWGWCAIKQRNQANPD